MKNKEKYLDIDGIHEGLLGILIEFDRVCQEHNLCYSLMGGTLLGAIRHKGFIPWDDDVDVMMPRPDYERLYALIHDGTIKFNEHFLMTEDRGKGAPYPFMKLLDDRYAIHSVSHVEVPYLFVDVFPMDGVPDLPEKQLKKMHNKQLFYNFVTIMCKWYVFADKWWAYPLRVLCFWFYLICICYGQDRSIRKLNEFLLKYPYEECERCDARVWGMRRNYTSKTMFDNICDVDFEGYKFKSICDWDNWLTNFYGDYMQIPPVGKRQTHHLKVYKTED